MDVDDGPYQPYRMNGHISRSRIYRTHRLTMAWVFARDQIPRIRRARTRSSFGVGAHTLPPARRTLAELLCTRLALPLLLRTNGLPLCPLRLRLLALLRRARAPFLDLGLVLGLPHVLGRRRDVCPASSDGGLRRRRLGRGGRGWFGLLLRGWF